MWVTRSRSNDGCKPKQLMRSRNLCGQWAGVMLSFNTHPFICGIKASNCPVNMPPLIQQQKPGAFGKALPRANQSSLTVRSSEYFPWGRAEIQMHIQAVNATTRTMGLKAPHHGIQTGIAWDLPQQWGILRLCSLPNLQIPLGGISNKSLFCQLSDMTRAKHPAGQCTSVCFFL